MRKRLCGIGCCLALTSVAQMKGIVEPGAGAATIQATANGWEIVDWSSADVAQAGESVYTVTFEKPLAAATLLTYQDQQVRLEPMAVGETRTEMVFRVARTLVNAGHGSGGVAGSQWAGFGSGKPAYRSRLPYVGCLSFRAANVAGQAVVTVSSADKLSSGFRPLGWLNRPETLNDGFVDEQRNFFSAPRETMITPEHPEWIVLSWSEAQALDLIGVMRGRDEKGLGEVVVESYQGVADPRTATAEWRVEQGAWSPEERFRSAQWFAFATPVKTRAIRLRCVGGVKQISVGEVLAVRKLGTAAYSAAVQPKGTVPITFTIPDAGKVTLQVCDTNNHVVANPVTGVAFTKGTHTVYWNLDDVQGKAVTEPGAYRWHGLYVPGLKVSYQYSYYPMPLQNVAWQTPDRKGGWLADHEPPRTICRAGTNMWLGAFAEMGDSIAEVACDGRKLWGIDRVWVAIPTEICSDGAYYYGFCEGGWIGDNQAIIRIDTATKASQKIFHREMATRDKDGFFGAKGITGFQVVSNLAFVSMASDACIQIFDLTKGQQAKPQNFSWDMYKKAFDEQKPVLVGEIKLPSPGRLRKYGRDALVTTSGRDIVLIQLADYTVKPLIRNAVNNPLGLGVADDGTIYVGEGAPLHQVIGFKPTGERCATLGKPGARTVGAFDTHDLEEPYGVEVAADGKVWVAEHTDWTRRVSLWDPKSGQCVHAVYGPTQYGGDGCVDPADERRLFYKGLEFRRDPASGAVSVQNLLYRSDNTNVASFCHVEAKHGLAPEDGNYPSYAFRAQAPGQKNKELWFTSYMHPHGHGVLVLWKYEGTRVRPVAALGSAYTLRATFHEPIPDRRDRAAIQDTGFLTNVIAGYQPDQKFFTWTDLNNDAQVQVNELKFGKLTYKDKILMGASAGWTWRMNEQFVAAANAGEERLVFFTPSGFTAQGYPRYEVPTETVSGSGESIMPDSSNHAIVLGGPLTCVTTNDAQVWRYRNDWPGLHAGHKTTARGDEPGVLIAPTRIWGIVPVSDALGEVVAFNSNLGCTYLMTARDGLYIDRVFRDQRVGLLWNYVNPPTPDVMAETSLYDEHFGGLLQKTVGAEGREKYVYVVGKNHCSVVELEGLDKIQRLSGGTLTVAAETVAAALEIRQQQALKVTQPKIYSVARVQDGAIVIGQTSSAWPKTRIDGFALCYDAKQLYVNYQGQDGRAPFENKGENLFELFKTGDVIDLMLQTKAGLRSDRSEAGEGDIRISFSMFNGKPVCVLYDYKLAVTPTTRVPFSSPWRTLWCDRVVVLDDVRIAVNRAGSQVTLTAAIPLASIHFNPAQMKETRGDVGRVESDESATRVLNRTYWSNKNTQIMSDLPTEAGVQPSLWGVFRFE